MIVLKEASYIVRDASRVERNADLVITGERITRVGATGCVDPQATVIDCRGRAVIPGLINAHTHLYQSMLKGHRDDLPLVEWCEQVTFPFVRRVLQRARRDGSEEIGRMWSLLGAMEMVRQGTTCFIDMDIGFDSVLQAWQEIGIRAVAAMTLVDQWVPPDLMLRREQTMADTISLIERWHGVPREAPLVHVFLGPSAPFTCSRVLLDWILDQSTQYDLGISTHVSETAWEVEQSLRILGERPLTYLHKVGLLERPLVAVHGVHLSPQEVELAADHPLVVAYNPKSNMKLGSGTAPIVALRAAGACVAIGTDGPASNDLLDMFEEMRVGALLQKVAHQDPTALGARDVFAMATEGGARACRIDAGTLDEGKLADIAVVNLSGLHLFTLSDDIVSALVYCGRGSDVETVIINGRPVMVNRRLVTVDEDILLREARQVGESYVK